MIFVKDSPGAECLMTREQAAALVFVVANATALDLRSKPTHCWLTSCIDRSGPMNNSLHPHGAAWDFKLIERGPIDGLQVLSAVLNPTLYEAFERELRLALGKLFDVFVHGEGAERHVHIEYDPKGRVGTPGRQIAAATKPAQV